MYKAKDGKRFGSIFAGKHYDENHSEDGMHSESEEKPAHEISESPEFEAGEQEGSTEAEKSEDKEGDEHPVVAEHGKAHKVVISHDEKAGRHTVTSHHKDGHVHSAVHEHPHKAHEEARKLAGVMTEKAPEEKAAPSTSHEEDGFSMPELS